ncbi:MFS transporter [Solirubrobacter taibaiensis]|nr:MFS transporter [Solirubrobacter taibaiensis]
MGRPCEVKVGLPCIAQFVIVLDVTIVAIALPVVQEDLGLSDVLLAWVVTVYPLVFGGCLLAAGRVADRFGRRRVFAYGLWVFGGASLLCALAPSGAVLLGGRVVQGVGAALVSPAALALVTAARPSGPERGRALGWWTAAAAGGGASGWVLGGLLSGWLDWRWVFLVNVPVCLVAALLAPRVLAENRPHLSPTIDVGGAVLVTTGLGALVLALSGYPLALVPAAVLLGALVFVERRARDPLIDPRVLGRRAVLAPNAVAAVLTATTTPIALLCVLHAQQDLELSPATAGLLFPPFNLAVIAASLAGPRRGAIPGGLAAIGAGGIALAISPAIPVMLVAFVLMGGGLGLASVASTARGTAAIDAADQGIASAVLATSAQLGTAFGLALFLPLGFLAPALLALMLPARTALLAVARRAAPRSRSPHPPPRSRRSPSP